MRLLRGGLPEGRDLPSDELELADYSRQALVYDMEKLKRPKSKLVQRMQYVDQINHRWKTSSTT